MSKFMDYINHIIDCQDKGIRLCRYLCKHCGCGNNVERVPDGQPQPHLPECPYCEKPNP